MPQTDGWSVVRCGKKDVPTLEGIFSRIWSGEIAAVVIEGFWPSEQCREITARVAHAGISEFDYGTAIVKTVGVFLMQFAKDPAAYFTQAKVAEKSFQHLFAGLPDPRAGVREALASLAGCTVRVPQNAEGIPYSASVLRIHDRSEGAPLHRDKALVDAVGFEVSRFPAQLSAVMMINPPGRGGELVMYRKLWDEQDECFKNQGALGYSSDAVAGAASVSIAGGVGDLYILNPSFFHEIRPVLDDSRRITLGTFVAFDPTAPQGRLDEVVAWS